MGCDRGYEYQWRVLEGSIHAPTWGATFKVKITTNSMRFQSTHPHGVRPKLVVLFRICNKGFNPRTHMGCDFKKHTLFYKDFLFQSTHPHGVRPEFIYMSYHPLAVSIHAPTWGATRIHLSVLSSTCSFNPRTHMGCDLNDLPSALVLVVSIHAPTWGATLEFD